MFSGSCVFGTKANVGTAISETNRNVASFVMCVSPSFHNDLCDTFITVSIVYIQICICKWCVKCTPVEILTGINKE